MDSRERFQKAMGTQSSIVRTAYAVGNFSRARTLPITCAILAYVLGSHPPASTKIEIVETPSPMPQVQSIGFSTKHFSALSIEEKNGVGTTYHPGTAVRRWDGAEEYTERSIDGKQIYGYSTLEGRSLHMRLPFKPEKVIISGKEYTTAFTESMGTYDARFPLENTMIQPLPTSDAEAARGNMGTGIHALIYYAKTQEKNMGKIDQDAEMYRIEMRKAGEHDGK